MQRHHNAMSGHGGVERTLQRLQAAGLTWENQRMHVRRFVQVCPRCQKMSQLKPVITASRYMLSSFQPMQQLAMDFIEALPTTQQGFNSILVIIDTYSRFVELYPCQGTTADAACNAIVQHLGRYGIPDEILTDNGPAFRSDLFNALCNVLDLDHVKITPYSHEENGIVERANKEVSRFLSDIINERDIKDNWSFCLPLVQRIMNAAVHSTIGVAPASVIFGNGIDLDRNLIVVNGSTMQPTQVSSIQSHMDVMITQQQHVLKIVHSRLANLARSQLMEDIRNDRIRLTSFPIDSLVLVRHREGQRPNKLAPRWLGPMRVINISKHGRTYTLQNLVTMRNYDYHVTQLKEYLVDDNQIPPLEVATKDHNDFYVVEKILNFRGDLKGPKTQLEFLVQWQGYDETTWEPWSSVRTLEQLHIFLKQHSNNRKVRELLPKNFK